jgi:ribosomal-protein-alanine N-acetyltransferase
MLPQIETDRLCLVEFSPDDAESVYSYASDADVARYTAWHPHRTVDDSAAWLDYALSQQNLSAGSLDYPWAIRKKDGTLIGCIAFKQTSPDTGRIDYVLSKPEWRKGLMTEAAIAALGWVFDNVDSITEVESGGLTENVASVNLLHKSGMTLRKTVNHRFPKFGDTEKEVSYFSITRDEWSRREANKPLGHVL